MIIQVPSSNPVQLPGLPVGTTRTVSNLDGKDTIYYGGPNVSAANATGSIAPGAIVTLDGRGWYMTGSGTGAEADIELSSDGGQPWEVAVEQLRTTVNSISSNITGLTAGALSVNASRTSNPNVPVLRDMVSVKDYGVQGDAASFTGTGTLTGNAFSDVTSTPFSAASVGKTIIVPGSGTGGRNASYSIQAFTDSSHVTLNASAVTNVANVNYQFGTNDTTNLQTAVTNATGLTLWFPSGQYIWSSVVPKQGSIYMGWGAIIWQLPGQLNALFYGRQTDGVTFFKYVRYEGFQFHGEGIVVAADGQLDAVWMQQWSYVYIVDCTADGFADSAFSTRDTSQVWFTRLSATNCCHGSGRNAFVLGTGTSAIAAGSWYVEGCYSSGIGTAALSMNSQAATTIGPSIVQYCEFTASGFAVLTTEINGAAGVESLASRVVVANNFLQNVGANASAMCVYVIDDTSAGAYSTDPLKISDYIIQANVCYTASNAAGNAGITVFASRTSINLNIIVASALNSRCILVKQNTGNGGDTTIMQNLDIEGNKCYATSATGTQNLIEVNNTIHWGCANNRLFCANTAGGDGIHVGGGCQHWEIKYNRINNAAFNGIGIISMKDGQVLNNTVYNANANNTASTSSGCGINVAGTAPTGTYNAVNYNVVYDDRGTHQMLYAFLQNGSGATNPELIGNRASGALTNITNSTANWTTIKGNRTDSPNFPAGSSAPAAPATTVNLGTTSYPRMVSWFGGTVTVVNVVPANGGTSRQVSNTTPGSTYLDSGEDINWTYTVAPTLAVNPKQ